MIRQGTGLASAWRWPCWPPPQRARPRRTRPDTPALTAWVSHETDGGPNGYVTPIDTATNAASDTVTPVTVATGIAGKPIKVGSDPSELAITPDGKTVYVVNLPVNGTAGTVTPISTATNTPGKAIPVGAGPAAIVITPNGKTAYVGNAISNTVTPISTVTNTAGKAITVSSRKGYSNNALHQAPASAAS
jgi:DNA-binding beta-propeller fold protein YncE